MSSYRDERRFVSVQLYALAGGSISRYKRFSRLGGENYQARALKSTERLLAMLDKAEDKAEDCI